MTKKLLQDHTTIIGRNIIFLNKLVSSVYKFKHRQCKTHVPILHSYILQLINAGRGMSSL